MKTYSIRELNTIIKRKKYPNHFSIKEMGSLHNHFLQVNSDYGKPKGLWYGIGNSWLDWMLVEEFRYDDYNFIYELVLNQENILRVTNLREFDAFEKKYMGSTIYGLSGVYVIDWNKVAKEYTGIEISPYLHSRRLSRSNWYYPWDVASGCIWDPDETVKRYNLLYYKCDDDNWVKTR